MRFRLKEHATLLDQALRIIDPLLVAIVGIAAYSIHPADLAPAERYWLAALLAALATATIFPAFHLYRSHRGQGLADELRTLLTAWSLLGLIGAALLFLTKTGIEFSRVWTVLWFGLGFLVLVLFRIALRVALRALRRRGRNLRHVAIVGAGPLGRTVAERLAAMGWTGFNVMGFYDDDAAKHGTTVAERLVVGRPEGLAKAIADGLVDQVWIALPLRAELRIREILAVLDEHSVEIRFVPDIHGFHLLNHSLTEVAGLPIISLTETPMAGVSRLAKAVEDYLLASAALVVTLPLLLAVALGIRLTSPGPILYRQTRVTWNGQPFGMLKFRTMPVDAEGTSGPVWARQGEQRATRLGTFLRRFSLDELPQLANVLRGEMSLVGPRPERPEFVEQFRRAIPGYMQKHLVKAGITGWAQVNDLRGDSDLALRIQYDLYYIDHWSLWFDLRILALTLWHILKSRNAR